MPRDSGGQLEELVSKRERLHDSVDECRRGCACAQCFEGFGAYWKALNTADRLGAGHLPHGFVENANLGEGSGTDARSKLCPEAGLRVRLARHEPGKWPAFRASGRGP